MSPLLAVFMYLIIWWVTIFMVLPIGVVRHEDGGQGHDTGAPVIPNIKQKLIWNTILSGVVLAVIYTLVELDVITWYAWFDSEKSGG